MRPEDQQVVSPMRTLLVLFVLSAGCTLLMWAIPEEGIPITDNYSISFARFSDLIPRDKEGIKDAESFLDNYTLLLQDSADAAKAGEPEPDSAAIAQAKEEAEKAELAAFRERMRIKAGPSGIENLDLFFQKASALSQSGGTLRVMHYGDSQIEADRITRYLRNELQKKYGGHGPGLITPVEVVPTGAVVQSASDNWNRYTIYGKKDTTITHNRYGIMGSFSSYDSTTATLTFAPSRMGYNKVKKYDRIKLFYCNYVEDALLEVLKGDSVLFSKNLAADSTSKTLNIPVSSQHGKIDLRFVGGPVECQALSFEGNNGILVDNIPMRGSSGTIFRKIDRKQFSSQLSRLNPGLIFLQYGGNSVPYVKDSTQAENYGRWMSSQVKLIQQILPETAIILIGPSDMATKNKEGFVTYPFLESVRDALKKTAIDTGCGYWDLYEVMGGRNSMEAWVTAEPPLAGSDYVHFTPKGATRVAELLVKALLDEAHSESK